MWLAAAVAAVIGLAPAWAQDWDKKTTEKMLSDGAKKLASAKAEDRETGMDWILGYLQCPYRKQYQPVLVKALKDSSPKVRSMAAQSLEKIQATDAVADLIPLLEDPDDDVKVRVAYTLGGLGKASESAVPAIKKAQAAATAANKNGVEGSMENALGEIAGQKDNKRYTCP
jgi:HEAT repeat protein